MSLMALGLGAVHENNFYSIMIVRMILFGTVHQSSKRMSTEAA